MADHRRLVCLIQSLSVLRNLCNLWIKHPPEGQSNTLYCLALLSLGLCAQKITAIPKTLPITSLPDPTTNSAGSGTLVAFCLNSL